MITLEFHKNTDTILNFCYLAIILSNFKSVDEKLPELEPRVSHSFVRKIVSRKKLLKVSVPPQTHFRWNFSVSKSHCVYEISQYFFAILKLYFWSIYMAKNLILAISFGFKLNSSLNWPSYVHLGGGGHWGMCIPSCLKIFLNSSFLRQLFPNWLFFWQDGPKDILGLKLNSVISHVLPFFSSKVS